MKVHRNLAEAVVVALPRIFKDKEVAERVVEQTTKSNPKWGKRDRAFVAEAVYEIVRWRRLYAAAAESEAPWALLSAYLVGKGIALPEWPELRAKEAAALQAALADESLPRAIRQSIPDWLDELGVEELGDRWDAELAALNGPADVILRVNTLKIDRETLQQKLEAEGVAVEPVEALPDALRLKERRAVTRSPLYAEGYFEVQDGASQMVAALLQPEPGQRVIDACAGAGGKSLHLAAIMENEGGLLAMDRNNRKLQELERRAERSGIDIIHTEVAHLDTVHRLAESADRVLLDVPCSGTGTMRRQPDVKWRLTPEFLDQVRQRQGDILANYTPMVKVDGLCVYSTCSILRSENEDQIQWFLAEHPDFELLEERRVWPSVLGFDGFYMALLRRKSAS